MERNNGVGFPLPDETLPTIDGEMVRLNTLLGTRHLVFMWGSW